MASSAPAVVIAPAGGLTSNSSAAGDATDAGVDRLFLNGVRRLGLDLRTTRLAGRLRARAGTGSAVDAIVVAVAEGSGGVVLTQDPKDLKALATQADSPVLVEGV